MSTKATIARRDLEMEKLQPSEKSRLRMMIGSTARLRMKYGRTEEPEKDSGETEARKIRMYETHFPGFCYLRNGEYRKKSTNNTITTLPDPMQCSSKIKSILFTDNELDNFKTMCLHLLSTHVQNKSHIQRKDGRLCSFVKTQTNPSTVNTLHPMNQRGGYSSETPSKYDKMLPRYILDVKMLSHGISTTSFKTSDVDSGSDDESKKKRKLIVPIFVNNEIRMIINSVLEALETVESPKLREIIELASSPEELRNMLAREEAQEYIAELAQNPLVMKPTSYDFVMAHLMFDKIPEKGTLETVAQVLEVYDDPELKNSLHQVRKGILNKHLEMTNSNINTSSTTANITNSNNNNTSNTTVPRKKNSVQETVSPIDLLKAASVQSNSSQKNPTLQGVANAKQGAQEENKINEKRSKDLNNLIPLQKKNQKDPNKKNKSKFKSDARNVGALQAKVNESAKEEESSDEESHRLSRTSADSNKSQLHNLTNPQRILLGLKVASLKSRPINMHQFEGKKKVDIAAIINPIIRTQTSETDNKQNISENHLQKNFALARLKPERSAKKSISKISTMSATDLENLTRALLAQLRLEIAETENKKRLNQFMAKI